MKKIIFTLSALFFIGASSAQILIDQEVPGNTTQVVVAPEYIRMMPGFGYKADGENYFRAYIDENASTVLPVTYQEYIDPETRELDFNLPVGSTGGMASVSLTGAATYTIPIFYPPGTAGMQPSLSLFYNSQSGNGIAGYGWNISGISAITRTGHTIYHDGIVEGIDFDDDRFMLDGQRLIKTSENQQYGENGTTYYPEVFNGSKIISHGITGNGPEWFEVIGKDGSIVEYGITDNSRLTSQRSDQATITWYISKITDPNGNYILFIYDKRALEINIKEIKYTGNHVDSSAIVEPYNSIKFYYSDRTDNSTAFVSGSRIEQTLLLDHIDIVSEKNIVKFYKLKYLFDFYSKLNEVEEFGSDGSHFNSTVFGYDTSVYINSVNNTEYASEGNIIMFVDFNNDGLSDIFKGGSNGSNEKSWEIHLNQGEEPRFNNEPDFDGNLLDTRDHKFSPIDFDGDGFMDILIYSFYSRFSSGEEFCDLDLLHNTGSDFVTYHLLDENDLPGWRFDNFNTEICVLDMDGDNKDEFILWIKGECNGNLDHHVYFFNIQQINNTIVANIHNMKPYLYSGFQPTNILALDLNGDNKDELIIVKEDDKSEIYEFKKENNVIHSTKIYDNGFPTSYHHLLSGDFNGDGRVDLLSHVEDSQHKTHWNLSYWLDGGFIENEIIDILPENNDPIFYSVGDFNSDGKADLNYTYNEDLIVGQRIRNKVYYSYNDSFKSSTNELFISYLDEDPNWQVPPQPFPSYLSDFDGDGISDWGFAAAGYIRYVITKPWVNFNTLKMVANGFNAKNQFIYNTLASQSIYSTSGQLDYPIRHFVYPLKVVETLSTDNGLGDFNSSTYNYANGIIHLEGKGFLGFKEFRTYSSIFPICSVSKYEVQPTKYFMQPVESYTYRNAFPLPSMFVNHTQNENQIETAFESTNKVFLPWQSLITEKDFATRNKKTTQITIDHYGNPLTQQVKFFESHSATTEKASVLTEYQDYWSASGNIPSKPRTIISTANRNEQAPISKTNKIVYDSKGNITSTVDFFGLPKAVTTTYSDFTVVGLPKTTTVSAADMERRISYTEFDSKYRFVISQTDAEGYVSYTINEPAFGNKLSVTNANEQTLTMEYNGFGTLLRQTDDLGVWSKTEVKWYTGINKPNVLYYYKSTSNNGLTSTKYFDKLGRALYTTNTDPNEQISCIKTVYNNKGQVESVSEPYFETTTPTQFITTTYHPVYGFPVSTTLPTGVIVASTTPTPENPGRTSSVTNSATGITTSKEADCTGRLMSATDPGGTLFYTYYSDGQTKQIDSPDGSNVTITYDEYGRQKTLTDPDVGEMIYINDAFGQLIYQKDAKGNIFEMEYDKLGRLIEKKGEKNNQVTNQVFEYFPFTAAKGRRGAIDYVHYVDEEGNNTRETYQYNDKAQLAQKTIVTDNNNKSFTYLYTYDSKGNLDEYTYPSGFTIKNEYKPDKGTLEKVIDKRTNTAIYKPGAYNARGQMRYYAMSNGLLYTTLGYDDYGLPTYRMTGNNYPNSSGIQYLETNFDPITGNLNWRKDSLRNLTESFTYDPVHKNRLATWQVTGQQPYSSTYNDANGNILTKTDFTSPGNPYTYIDAGPHAVTGVSEPLLMPAEAEQSIEYNTFNKASRITRTNPDLQLVLRYGPGEQRIKTEQKSNGQTILTKYFAGDGLEIEVSATGEERWLHYLPGGGLYVCDKDFNEIGMYYVLSDYLGSWQKVITPTGATIEEYSFDPWGRRRNPENWSHTGVSATFVFDRGFTGHEMLDPFGLVNMNGRMYDPLLGRMLSPDNYVQSPGSTQGFNRYSYALNNPLVYTDPSGDNPAIIAMIAYSAIVSGLSSAENGNGFIDGFVRGAATSAFSYGVGAALGPVVAGGTRLAGMANAGINAAVAGVITNGMNALVSNNAFNWKAYGLNIATSMAFAGLTYQKPSTQLPNYSYGWLPFNPGRGYGMSNDIPPGWKLICEKEGFQEYNIPGVEIVAPAAGQGGNQISMDASHNRIGFVPLDVGENYGAYQMANYRSNISVRGNQNQITVRATSSNTPVADGQVVFGARASLVVNGNITQTQVLANGLAVFKLPSSQNVSLTVNGGWTVRYDAGGAAVPVYHPIFWPFSLNFTDNFNLK